MPSSGWVAFPLWFALTALFVMLGDLLVPGPLRRLWASLFPPRVLETHGSAHFGTAAIGARHLAPAAPADAFVLGYLPDAPRKSDARFRQDGHILTCAPTGAGKGVGGVIPNLLDYPGSAFVLDFKARTTPSLPAPVASWASLPVDRRTMAELRRIVTASADDLAATLDDMTADPEAGQRIPARTAAAHLNRPERERGSVLSTVVRHTAWLDDPRLCAALARSNFSMADLKRQPMTIYLAIPPDRLRACLGFVRGFIGLALDGVTAAPGKPVHRVAFFLDEFVSLGAWTAWRTA